MTAEDTIKQINDKIMPQLQELGVEAFVMAAYIRDNGGKITKARMGADGGNPAYQDGLRSLNILHAKWGQGQL